MTLSVYPPMQVVIMLTMHVREYDVSNFDYITVSEKVFAGWAAASVVNELQQVHDLGNITWETAHPSS